MCYDELSALACEVAASAPGGQAQPHRLSLHRIDAARVPGDLEQVLREREIILERQREGIAKAKAEGRYKGRPLSIDVAEIRRLSGKMGAADSAKHLGIAGSSIYRLLGEA